MEPDARPAERWKPTELGVHPTGGGRPGSMPAYVRRPHDEVLRSMLDPGVPGSRLIVVRGEACTGKSRAAYEAVADRLADWSLEYPPTAAALAARLEAGIPAWTVLWLGELCRYADADGGAAALSRLAGLLEGDGHVVITTMWPEHWAAYVTAAGARLGAGHPARAAGRLVTGLDELTYHDPDPAYGGVIDVPSRFTAGELTAAAARGDPVLAAAAAAAEPDGQVTQCLAGGPALLRRLDGPGGDAYGRAMITAAMDAARLGQAGPLPAALVQDAAVGYLAGPPAAGDVASRRTDALVWAGAELDGAVRALDPVRPAADDGLAAYRIAGYLDQHGRRTRQGQLGPASLWDALTARPAGSGAGDLTRVAQAAGDRGLYRHAAAGWTAAVSAGSADAAGLARDPVSQGSFDDLWEAAALLAELRAAGASDAVRALLARDPASHGHIDYADSVACLLSELRAAGAHAAVRALLARDPASHVDFYDRQAVGRLAAELHAAGDIEAVRTLATRAADCADPEDPGHFAEFLEEFRAAGDGEAIRILLARDPAGRACLDDPGQVAWLLEEFRAAGAGDAVQTLLARDPAAQVRLDHPHDVARLLRALRAAGADDALQALLATRAAIGVSLEDPAGIARLLEELRAAGAGDAVRALLARDPADQVSLGPDQQPGVGRLLTALRAAGAGGAAGALAARAADAGMFDLAVDRASYPFGREPDGAPAPPWLWAELLPDPG